MRGGYCFLLEDEIEREIKLKPAPIEIVAQVRSYYYIHIFVCNYLLKKQYQFYYLFLTVFYFFIYFNI